MIEPALFVANQSTQRRRPIHLRGRSVGLKIVDAHLLRSVHVEPRLREERRNVAARAVSLTTEYCLSPLGREIESLIALRRLRLRNRELVEVQRSQLRGDQV